MALVAWSPALSVGVARFDKEHQELVKLLNSLHDEMLKGKAKDALSRILGQLINYTVIHFKSEEDLFRKYAYPQAAAHTAEHEALKFKAADLEKALREGTSALSTETLNFLREWLVRHIQGSDMQYKAFFEAKGIK
jgi:hemerythrin